MTCKTNILCILDGFGVGDDSDTKNAIHVARTPNLDYILTNYHNSILDASGVSVGLPEGQFGSSEIGHGIIGSGRVILQSLPRISNAILSRDSELMKKLYRIASKNKIIHIVGLLSDGGVHSHVDHILGIAKILSQYGCDIKIHAISDGRDVSPMSGRASITDFCDVVNLIPNVELVSICGRYYAMDRDSNDDRVKVATDLYLYGIGKRNNDIFDAISNSYRSNVTDEFLRPIICGNFSGINDGDGVLFANFRADRMRQLVRSMCNELPKFISVWTMSDYFDDYDIQRFIIMPIPIFKQDMINETLADVISNAGLTQLHVAETEKYAHVTFFLNGGKWKKHRGEDWILIPSPKVDTYDLKPEMSADLVCDTVVQNIGKYDFIMVNFANCDMVGHTGNFEATIKAVESVDSALGKIMNRIFANNGQLMITADHGNAESMIDNNGYIHTQHTMRPVPLMIISKDINLEDTDLHDGTIADVAPTFLSISGLDIPHVMTGKVLLSKKI